MNEKQIQKALDGKRNLFITGSAGTGKTYLLRHFIEEHPNTLVCAPTGTAAENIGGTTIHRAFGVPVPAYDGNIRDVSPSTLKTIAAADTIIVDEISMCRNDVFAFMVKVLHKAERMKGAKIRMIVSGDFFQLPPVVQKREEKFFRKFGLDPSGFPFTCKEWESMHFKTIELTEIHRQDNNELISHLNEIREGNSTNLDYFRQFVRDVAKEGIPENTIYICGTNAEAEEINTKALDALTSFPAGYTAKSTGRIYEPPQDKVILLKEGERVMFIVNDVRTNKFQNGTMGTILKVFPDHVRVQKDAPGEKPGEIIEVFRYTWTMYSYKTKDNQLLKTETGTFEQLPLKPAYAITIHKAQGKTFERAVISPKAFAPGQLYVALSRVKSPEGLILTEPILDGYVLTSEEVVKFIKNGYKWKFPKKVSKNPSPKPAASTLKEKKRKSAESSKKKTAKKPSSTLKKETGKKGKAKKDSKKPPKASGKSSSKASSRKPGKSRISSSKSMRKKKLSPKQSQKEVGTKKKAGKSAGKEKPGASSSRLSKRKNAPQEP